MPESTLESRADDALVLITASNPQGVRVNGQPMVPQYIRSVPVLVPVVNTLTGENETDESGEPVMRTAYEQTDVTAEEYVAAEQNAGISPHPDAAQDSPATAGFVTADGVLYRATGLDITHSAVLPSGVDFCDCCGKTHDMVEVKNDTFKRQPVTLTARGAGRYCPACLAPAEEA